jgi:hypothetical protein
LGWLVSYSVPGDPERVLGNSLSSVSIIIDGKLHRTIETYSDLSSPATSYEQLTNLEDGAHNLTIKVYCEGWDLDVHGLWEYSLPYNVASDLVYFTVDSAAPFVSVLAPENKSYESTEKTLDLQFSFTVNEPVSKVTYSLDGQTNTTVAGNMSLTNLHHGEHNVTVYATDNAGNIGRSETIDFTIAKPVPESFSVMPIVVASGVFMAAVGLSLLVYFKKRKR